MKKFLEYILGVVTLLNTAVAFAADKFEVLPDLPDAISHAGQPVQAAAVTGTAGISDLGVQSVGNEPSVISVVLSLLFVILLIYLTGIIYAKLNRAGFNTLKSQQGELARSQVSVISTTQLGNNKTLHVVELDGKRMLIGASSGAIQLIKDLGVFNENCEGEDYSHIEIPNIQIPKIEIPKIEIPAINFSKFVTKVHKSKTNEEVSVEDEHQAATSTLTEIKDDGNSDGIIDTLFTQPTESAETIEEEEAKSEHIVNPEDYSLHKKYLS